jgi:hypothetical protein
MVSVTQTKVVVRNSEGNIVQNGNCWAAAIASILEIPITEVPNFEVWFQWEDGMWWYLTDRFLLKKGFKLESIADQFRVFHMTVDEYQSWCDKEEIHPGDYHQLKADYKDEFYFACGPSARGVSHVTIWKNGSMVHDPHPTREGIIELKRFEWIRKLTQEEIEMVNDYKNHYTVAFPANYLVKKETVN